MNAKYFLTFICLYILSCSAPKKIDDSSVEVNVIYSPEYYWAIKPTVNIRSDNNGSSNVIGSLADGDSVITTVNNNGWYKVKTNDNIQGWVRTDLLGPRNLSVFLKAVTFINNLKNEDGIELFFDKKLQHKRIYLSYPENYYTSKSDVEKQTRSLVRKYQNEVYRGNVTARVLQPDSDEEYLTIDVKGYPNPEYGLPVLPFGRVDKTTSEKPTEISLTISIPENIKNNQLLATARNISSVYPVSFEKVDIEFITYEQNKKKCRLWFQEGAQGEQYKFNRCQ